MVNPKKTRRLEAILATLMLMAILLVPSVSAATSKSFTPDLSRISEPVKGVELIPEQFKTNYGTYTIEKGYWFDVFNWFKQDTLREEEYSNGI